MLTEPQVLVAAPSRPARAASATNYGSALGLVLLGLFLVSTVSEAALAPVGRGLALLGFGILTFVNAGAAIGVYMGAALLFSEQHFSGQGSWVDRPDNFCLLFLTMYLVMGRTFRRSAGRFGRTAIAVGLLLVTGIGHLAVVVGLYSNELPWFMRMFGIPLAMFVLLRRARLWPQEINSLLLLVAVAGVYASIMTLLEVGQFYDFILPWWIGDPQLNPFYGSARIGGVPMQPEWNALVISLSLCVLLLRLDQEPPAGRLLWSFGAFLCMAALFFTFTRAAWLGLVLGGVPLFWQRSAARGVTFRRRVLFVFGAIAFGGIIFFGPSEALQSRTTDTGTVFFRFNVWIGGFRMLLDHPLFGVGYGQFSRNVIPYLGVFGSIPESPGLNAVGTIAHNTTLSVAAELGLIGLGLYIAILTGAFKAAWTAATAAYGPRGQSWVAGFTIIYLTNIQFVTAHELTPNLLFFGLLGAVAGLRTGPVDPMSQPAYGRFRP